jgi:hypothetical protein
LDASTALEDGEDIKPMAGDYSMCLHCGAILVYLFNLEVRIAETADLAKLSRENLAMLLMAQKARQEAQKVNPDFFSPKPEAKH